MKHSTVIAVASILITCSSAWAGFADSVAVTICRPEAQGFVRNHAMIVGSLEVLKKIDAKVVRVDYYYGRRGFFSWRYTLIDSQDLRWDLSKRRRNRKRKFRYFWNARDVADGAMKLRVILRAADGSWTGKEIAFTKDTTSPETRIEIEGLDVVDLEDLEVFVGEEVRLAATDPAVGGACSGVSKTFYKVAPVHDRRRGRRVRWSRKCGKVRGRTRFGEWDGDPIVFEAVGEYRILFRSVDNAWNREVMHVAKVHVVEPPPLPLPDENGNMPWDEELKDPEKEPVKEPVKEVEDKTVKNETVVKNTLERKI